MAPEFVQLKQISMKGHPELNEAWLHGRLSEQPELLGLGELELLTSEKTLPGGGRLDLLFIDSNAETRYEVEVQLGRTDESHIIRTLEYWDIERRRYPQYEHVAVIVAEEITSRFFNVIGLFNGYIPIVAIQAKALELGNSQVTLDFTIVLNHETMAREEDEFSNPADRSYWEEKANRRTLGITDSLYNIIAEVDSAASLNYNKHYIGLSRRGIAANYISFKPMKSKVRMRAKWLEYDDIGDLIEDLESSSIEYGSFQSGRDYKFIVEEIPVDEDRRILQTVIKRALEKYNSK